MKKVEILGVSVNPISLKNAVSLVGKWVNSNKQYQITTPNPEQIVLAQENLAFKKALNSVSLAIPDGIGIVIAMRLLKIKNKILKIKNTLLRSPKENFERQANKKLEKLIIHRLSGTDLMIELCKLAAKKDWRVFLLGGRGESVAQAASKLQAQSSKQQAKELRITDYGLRITTYEGAEDIREETQQERREAIRRINKFRPHLLFVAYGAPYQELWISKNLPKLKVKVAMGVGGAFDYLAGRVSRAPKWMRSLGLEWLYRLIRQPWRIKRQLALVKFILLLLCCPGAKR